MGSDSPAGMAVYAVLIMVAGGCHKPNPNAEQRADVQHVAAQSPSQASLAPMPNADADRPQEPVGDTSELTLNPPREPVRLPQRLARSAPDSRAEGTASSSGAPSESTAVASLNKQIIDFNDTRRPNMGVSPIERRVSRVIYDKERREVHCLDEDGTEFLILRRESDGRFKGIVKTPYHQAAFSGPGNSHSWGHVLAEFYLEKATF